MTRRIFITIEYDGTPFVGWQRQVTGLSVQQVLEEAAAELTGGDILVPVSYTHLTLPTNLCV